MINIRNALELCIKHVDIREILKETRTYNHITREQFLTVAVPFLREYTMDELDKMYDALKGDIVTECNRYCVDLAAGFQNQPLNLYGLILLAVERMLEFSREEVQCRYEYLLEWRQFTVKISEDTLTTAFCALKDRQQAQNTYDFSWPSVIQHNNYYLRKLLQQELSDNHFHLWASAPHFGLSWIRLMNDVEDAQIHKRLQELDQMKLNVNQAYSKTYGEDGLEVQYMQAALIRLYLYAWVKEEPVWLSRYYLYQQEDNQVQGQLEKGFKANCRKVLENTENSKEAREKISDPEILKFLDRLENEEGVPPKTGKNLWEWVVTYMKQTFAVPLDIFETVLYPGYYKKLREECTAEKVKRWLQSGKNILWHSTDIQNAIRFLKRSGGTVSELDYALEGLHGMGQREEPVRWEFCGERYFMYRMFQKAYQRGQGYLLQLNLFYAYLALKENFRSEIIQSNGRIGFRNFQMYDRRKGLFINAGTVFERSVLKMAIKDTLSNPWLKHLEVRIVPSETPKRLRQYIEQIDGDGTMKDRYYYVCHFAKSVDRTPVSRWSYTCRHEQKRNQVKRQALSIAGVREKFPAWGKRILGIDGCSSEIGCRPEVFAQAFRYLKKHCVTEPWKSKEEKDQPQLRATYHVGEDFLDILDGLRAIDEAVHFLDLSCGDRLGHALALGLDVRQYYEYKHHKVYLPRQDYLDNLAWIYDRINKYHLGSSLCDLQSYVEREFIRYFGMVYEEFSQEHNYNIRTYFDAWQCRGDNPGCYQTGRFMKPAYKDTSYEGYAVNSSYPHRYQIRETEAVARLYYAYHFNADVKRLGSKVEEIRIPEIWVAGVDELQKEMQYEIASRGLGIEANPSSNCMISTLGGYEEHPLVNWYNCHLTTDFGKLADCPQISVSINTDDKGCFSTSLENEYALMACALEQKKDKNGKRIYKRTMIYEWLDEVRKMGNLQSFHTGGD